MNLLEEQAAFAKDIALFITFICAQPDWFVTLGEAYRTVEQQKLYVQSGRSMTMNSQHLKRLAVDLNFFYKGKLIWDKEMLRPFGEHWESMAPGKNRWGGNFSRLVDLPHFERIC